MKRILKDRRRNGWIRKWDEDDNPYKVELWQDWNKIIHSFTQEKCVAQAHPVFQALCSVPGEQREAKHTALLSGSLQSSEKGKSSMMFSEIREEAQEDWGHPEGAGSILPGADI